MKAVIEIVPEEIETRKCILICEVSTDGFSYVVKDDESNAFVALAVYHFSNTSVPVNHFPVFKKVFEDQALLSENYKKIYISYSFPESVLVPFPVYNSQHNVDVLNLVHGDLTKNNAVLSDVVTEINACNIYRLPAEVTGEMNDKFPSAETCHQYSALVKNLAKSGEKVSVIFYPQKIVLMIGKEGRLLLINSFFYKTAEDVSYILLNACRQLGIEHSPLEVGGLIEKDSALFKEIYKYFCEISFANLPVKITSAENIAKYPIHFFSHLFAVDS
ncbi:MAG: DUF3822 family protein [Bacteroidota bacterium]|nr:DUF3822 family protein [Bacteroidota bacterium]MDQ6889370.1 DUF3822 family protein [Bacteroidota bacterium]